MHLNEQQADPLSRLITLNEQKSNAVIQFSLMLSALAERMGSWAVMQKDKELEKEILAFRTQILTTIQPKEKNEDASTVNSNQ